MPGGQSTDLDANRIEGLELCQWILMPFRSNTILEVHLILGGKAIATIVGNQVIGLQNVHTHHPTLMAMEMATARRRNSSQRGNSRSPDIA